MARPGSRLSKVPPELRYSESHEWVRLEGDVATIGITDFAQDQLTDVVYVELPKKGAKIEPQKPFGVVESVKSVSDLLAPFAGEVVETNDALHKTPELINDDPYGRGWMIRVRVGAGPSVEALLDAAGYKKVIGE
jgi:glycine cleavage system H protein